MNSCSPPSLWVPMSTLGHIDLMELFFHLITASQLGWRLLTWIAMKFRMSVLCGHFLRTTVRLKTYNSRLRPANRHLSPYFRQSPCVVLPPSLPRGGGVREVYHWTIVFWEFLLTRLCCLLAWPSRLSWTLPRHIRKHWQRQTIGPIRFGSRHLLTNNRNGIGGTSLVRAFPLWNSSDASESDKRLLVTPALLVRLFPRCVRDPPPTSS